MISVYTIGYSTHSPRRFTNLLKQYEITTVCDVRSSPYSRYNPRFTKDTLMRDLNSHGIKYLFLGRELGHRSTDPACCRNGRIQYDLLARTDIFKTGMTRLWKHIHAERVALMCAEKDPVTCHRMILICRQLRHQPVTISHILDDGSLETQQDAENRLMKLMKIPQQSLFDTTEDLIQLAYDKQARRIACTQPS